MVKITRVIRRMRGGSQSWLTEGVNGHFYVVKAADNPQGRRTLANDWVGSQLLRAAGANAAECVLVEFSKDVIASSNLHVQFGKRRVTIGCGPHFGSLCPVNPEDRAIFDFLPDRLLPKVRNIADFAIAFLFDLWTANADARQAVFFRPHGSQGFEALLIDHGMCFQGTLWKLEDLRLQPSVNSKACEMGGLYCGMQNALDKLLAIEPLFAERLVREIPSDWLDTTDRDDLLCLMQRLLLRRRELPRLIKTHCRDFAS